MAKLKAIVANNPNLSKIFVEDVLGGKLDKKKRMMGKNAARLLKQRRELKLEMEEMMKRFMFKQPQPSHTPTDVDDDAIG